MVEINYIHCYTVPLDPRNAEALPEEGFEQLNEYMWISKEGARVILATREPTEEEIMESWIKLKDLKAQNDGA